MSKLCLGDFLYYGNGHDALVNRYKIIGFSYANPNNQDAVKLMLARDSIASPDTVEVDVIGDINDEDTLAFYNLYLSEEKASEAVVKYCKKLEEEIVCLRVKNSRKSFENNAVTISINQLYPSKQDLTDAINYLQEVINDGQ